jgi:tetratricopeptide (TPR) repeat protein
VTPRPRTLRFLPLVLALGAGLPGVARGDAGATLTTQAAASDRPAECGALVRRGERKPSIWTVSRHPLLGAYCDQIARAHALIESDPKAGLAAAKKADEVLPNHASSFTAMGRADVALGDAQAAIDAFEKASKLDARSLDEPKAMNDFARALVLSKDPSRAAALYRALVPRSELLPDKERTLVFLRAAHALMAHASSAPDAATSDYADAAAYLEEARTAQASGLVGDALLSLALVLDRSGDAEGAARALAEARDAAAVLTGGGDGYVAVFSDKLALEALRCEATDAKNANAAWQKFIDSAPDAVALKAAKGRLAQRKSPPPKKVR